MAATLHYRHVFGFRGVTSGAAFFSDNTHIVYAAGNFIIKHNLETRLQEFVGGSDDTGGVSALATSPGKRFVLVAEAPAPRTQASLRSRLAAGGSASGASLQRGAARGGDAASPTAAAAGNGAAAGAAAPDTPTLGEATVSVYNLRRLYRTRTLTYTPSLAPGAGSETVRAARSEGAYATAQVIACTMTTDDAHVAAIVRTQSNTWGGGINVRWSCAVWSMESGERVADLRIAEGDAAVYGIHASPAHPGRAVLYGRNVLRFISIEEGRVSFVAPVGERSVWEGADITAHTWVGDERCIAATSDGKMLLFDGDTLLGLLPEAPGNGVAITSLLTFSRGVLAGCVDGYVRVFEPSDAPGVHYAAGAALHCNIMDDAAANAITGVAVSPSEDTLACSIAGNQLVSVPLLQALVKDDAVSWKPLTCEVHGPALGHLQLPGGTADGCAITAMDACIRKPLVATAGVDATVRIWNYADKRGELSKSFADIALSLAFHPSGLHLLLGFSDKLRLMNVLLDDLRQVKELPIKNCREVRFARGGHIFAAGNAKLVQLFSTATVEVLHTLRGHSAPVTSLSFTPDDQRLLSAALDGRVYVWDAVTGARERDIVTKDLSYLGVAPSRDANVAWAVTAPAGAGLPPATAALPGEAGITGEAGLGAGAGGMASTASLGLLQPAGASLGLVELDLHMGAVSKEAPSDVSLGTIVAARTSPFLFAGAAAPGHVGTVYSYALPLAADAAERVAYPAVGAAVTRMVLSSDNTHLFIGGADGSLVVCEVRDKDGRLPLRDVGGRMAWSDECLVTRSDLEEMAAAIAELEEAQEELASNNEYAMRMREIAFQEEVKKVTERYTSELEAARQQYELLAEERLDLEREFGERIAAMEVAHRSELQKREALYQEKIMAEVERFQALEAEVRRSLEKFRASKAAAIAAHEQLVSSLTEAYEKRLEEARQSRRELEADAAGARQDWGETRMQMEGDLEEELDTLRQRYESRLEAEKQLILKCKSENGIMNKKFASLVRDIEELQEETAALAENKVRLDGQIHGLGKEIELLKSVISEKDVAIGEKEKRIYELKKQNQELEKFKFVLDYKIRELKRQIEPRENEIASMRAQIKEVDAELEAFHKSNSELDTVIGELRAALDGLNASVERTTRKVRSLTTTWDEFHADLHTLSAHILNEDELLTGFEALYAKYVPQDLPVATPDHAIADEFVRQKVYLEKSMSALKQKVAADTLANKAENVRIMQENLALIKQISQLRDQAAAMKASARPAPAAGTGRAASAGPAGQSVAVLSQAMQVGAAHAAVLQQEIARLEALLDRTGGGTTAVA